jgi:phosphoglycolate phosphatase-like HAD superfamily hydrolase
VSATTPFRLVLWNVDNTLVDVAQVTRVASAEAFEKVTGRPLVRLASTAGRTESEFFFESLALNDAPWDEGLLPAYTEALAAAFAANKAMLRDHGRTLPGAKKAVEAVGASRGTVQTVLTGAIHANTVLKLTTYGLDAYIDLDIGGYGSEVYPRATLLQVARNRAGEKHGVVFDEASTVYVADSVRDVEAAQIGGARMIAIASGRSTAAELAAAGADVVLDDLTDLGALQAALGNTSRT